MVLPGLCREPAGHCGKAGNIKSMEAKASPKKSNDVLWLYMDSMVCCECSVGFRPISTWKCNNEDFSIPYQDSTERIAIEANSVMPGDSHLALLLSPHEADGS
jgi:hypothetical protein